MSIVHELKTWPVYFDAVKRGEKTFEVRRDDRGFQKGDTVRLLRTREDALHVVEYPYSPRGSGPLHVIEREITYVLTGGQFGIEPGYVVLGLKEAAPAKKPAKQEDGDV